MLAAVAVVLALVLLAAGALLGGWRPFGTSVAVRTFGPGGDMAAFTLFEGQCASGDLTGDAGFGEGNDTPCGEPHDVEVVATAPTLDDARPVAYPGEGALARYGRAYCAMVVDSDELAPQAAGVAKDDLDVTAVIPDEAAFAAPQSAAASSSGSRQVACAISRSDGEKLGDRFSVI